MHKLNETKVVAGDAREQARCSLLAAARLSPHSACTQTGSRRDIVRSFAETGVGEPLTIWVATVA